MKIVFPSTFLAAALVLCSVAPAPLHAQVGAPTATKSTAPQLKVQVQVGNQQRRIGTSYRKQASIEPKFVIDGSPATRPIPELEAVMLIVTMDTRAKYKEKRDVYRVEAAETIKLPAVPNGARRTFEFAPTLVTYDAWRDTTNVGGATYKYYVFGLRDPETREILNFQTNNTALAALVKTNPARQEEFLIMKKGADFPVTIK